MIHRDSRAGFANDFNKTCVYFMASWANKQQPNLVAPIPSHQETHPLNQSTVDLNQIYVATPLPSATNSYALPLLLSLRWCLIGSDGRLMEGHDRSWVFYCLYFWGNKSYLLGLGQICGPQKMYLTTVLFKGCVIFTLGTWARGVPSCCMGMSRYTARSW